MQGRWLSYLPMVLAVCVVAAAAGYLVTHPPGTPPAPSTVPGPTPPPATPAPAPAPPQGSPPAPEPAPAPTPEQPAPPPATGPFTQAPAAPTPAAPTKAPPATQAPRGPAHGTMFHVQAGAFAHLENAEALVKQLHAKQYSATIVRGRLYRVWIGQPLDRPGAEQLAQRLRADGFEAALIPSQ